MTRTTIAITENTRARIKSAAARESKTIDAFLASLLDERERALFWASFEDVTPETYAAAVAADGDDLEDSYDVEDRAITAEES